MPNYLLHLIHYGLNNHISACMRHQASAVCSSYLCSSVRQESTRQDMYARVLLYKLACYWNVFFSLTCERQMYLKVICVVVIATGSSFRAVITVPEGDLSKETVTRHPVVSRCWQKAVKYLINQVHKHRALILTNKQLSESVDWRPTYLLWSVVRHQRKDSC